MKLPVSSCVLAVVLAACHGQAGTRSAATADHPSPPQGPFAQSERRTTSGQIARRNLEAQIASLERQPRTLKVAGSLVELLLTRAVVLGRLDDYDRVTRIAEDAVHDAPAAPAAYLLRARSRAALHDFQGALADLEEAERRGAPRARTDELRAEALKEIGRPGEALEIRRRLAVGRRDMTSLVAEAVQCSERGALEEARLRFSEAEQSYRDVSPFPFAWLYSSEGLMWEEAGDAVRARRFYRAALERLPGYPAATARLAEMEASAGRTDEAIALLRPLVESSDDPEYAGQLSALLSEEGQRAEADRLRASAAARFDDLVERHPAAFAAKASRFWLGAGRDPEKAVRLAELNLSARRTPEAQKLLLDARAALALARLEVARR